MFILATTTGGEDAVSKPVMTDDSFEQTLGLLKNVDSSVQADECHTELDQASLHWRVGGQIDVLRTILTILSTERITKHKSMDVEAVFVHIGPAISSTQPQNAAASLSTGICHQQI